MPDTAESPRTPVPTPSLPDAVRPGSSPREIALETITQGAREVIILHNGSHYRLRVTANDKLILTK